MSLHSSAYAVLYTILYFLQKEKPHFCRFIQKLLILRRSSQLFDSRVRLICRIVQQLFRRSRWQARADWFVEETAELPYLLLFASSFGKVYAMSALLIYRFFTFALLLSCSHVQRCAEKYGGALIVWSREKKGHKI